MELRHVAILQCPSRINCPFLDIFSSQILGRNDREPMIAKIGQETLAQMIDTTRARVSFLNLLSSASSPYNGVEVHS